MTMKPHPRPALRFVRLLTCVPRSSGKVQMWEATTLTLLGEVNASSTWVTTVRVTQLPQEGMALRLITASVDKTVRAWNIVEDAESPGSGTFVRVAMDSSSTGGA